jgi:hypothetical protein
MVKTLSLLCSVLDFGNVRFGQIQNVSTLSANRVVSFFLNYSLMLYKVLCWSVEPELCLHTDRRTGQVRVVVSLYWQPTRFGTKLERTTVCYVAIQTCNVVYSNPLVWPSFATWIALGEFRAKCFADLLARRKNKLDVPVIRRFLNCPAHIQEAAELCYPASTAIYWMLEYTKVIFCCVWMPGLQLRCFLDIKVVATGLNRDRAIWWKLELEVGLKNSC